MKAALHERCGAGDEADQRHRARGAHAAVERARLVLREHEREAEDHRRGHREGDASADAPPVRAGAQARGGAEHIKRQRQAGEDDGHRQQHAPLGAVAVEHARPQGRAQRIEVEGQQRQRHRQPRHRGIQAIALQRDQHADGRQRPAVPGLQRQRHALAPDDEGDDERGDAAAKAHRGDHVDAVVEGDARGDVVAAHHQGDEQQRGEGGAAEGRGGGDR